MRKLKPCDCGGKPILSRCGDHKELFIYVCPRCYKVRAKNGEARATEFGARRVWNKRAGDSE